MYKILSLQLNATYHWIKINIFIIINKYLIDPIKNIQWSHLIEGIEIFFSPRIDWSWLFNCDEIPFLLSGINQQRWINKDEKKCLITLICGSTGGIISPPIAIFLHKLILQIYCC